MKFNIPKHCHIRWQAALAVLEDLQEDVEAPFDMESYADRGTLWKKTNGCGTAACFAGYISVAPYCRDMGYPEEDISTWASGEMAEYWLLEDNPYRERTALFNKIFDNRINEGSRAKTLAYLEKTLKAIFKESTGKNLIAPLTFWI